jgi:hypothetical protein
MDENGTTTIEVERWELRTLCNALNEVLHGISPEDFASRLGVTREEAAQLAQKLTIEYRRMSS